MAAGPAGEPSLVTTIRPLDASDWPAVRSIFLEGIATGRATFETEAPSWEKWDAGHLAAPRLVAATGGECVAWATLSPVSQRRVYAGVAESSVYVAEACRGQGVGKALLGALVDASEAAGLWTLQAGIFATNVPSIRLHLSCGFRIVGTRERIASLAGTWHDVVLVERRSQ